MENQQLNSLTKQEQWEMRRREKEGEERKKKLERLRRRVVFWALVVLVIGSGLFGAMKIASRYGQDVGQTVAIDVIDERDWVKGDKEAKAIIIEYSDFQCPACAFYYPILKELSEEFKNDLAVVYRHFPLIQIHQNAKQAAYAAEAAGRQGKFWEMHDIIFDNQKEWKDKQNPEELFISYVQALDLDVEKFEADFASKEVRKKIDDAYQNATGLGLNSTPTFFLNGKKIQNPRNYEEFKGLIQQAISI